MKKIIAAIAAFGALAFAGMAAAAPCAYVTAPLDTVQAAANSVITQVNACIPTAAPFQTVTGSAGAATLNGVKGTITTESVSTAASSTYTETLTNSSINASSIMLATVGYGTATTGVPVVASVVTSAGQAVIKIQNVSTGAAFNGTLVIDFLVVN